jgi:hypothetical protein
MGLGAPPIRLRPQPLGSRTQHDPNSITASPEPRRRHCPSPTHPRPTSDAALPLVRSRPPMTSPTSSRLPNQDRPGMTGVKSPCPPLQQAWGRATDHYATHDGTICTIRACTEYGTTALDHYSHDQDEITPHFPPPRPRPSTSNQTARTNTPRRLQDQV